MFELFLFFIFLGVIEITFIVLYLVLSKEKENKLKQEK